MSADDADFPQIHEAATANLLIYAICGYFLFSLPIL
jgi:hypothetical protein